jgi:cell division protein FtsB
VQNVVTLKMEERELLQQQRELEARKAELEEELTQVDETDYIEQQAREQLHMIKPGEILYLLPDHDDKE